LIDQFYLDLGYRTSDYSTTGSDDTYKANVIWNAFGGLTFRGGIQESIRAPDVFELFSQQTSGFVAIGSASDGIGFGDPCDVTGGYRNGPDADQVRALCLAQGVQSGVVDNYTFADSAVPGVVGGNPNLEPEKAKTYTAGLVWRSSSDWPLAENLQVSIDYVEIDLTEALGSVSGTTTVQRCFNVNGFNPSYSISNPYCDLISRNATSGAIDRVSSVTENLVEFQHRSYDLQLDWAYDLERLGTISVNTMWSYLDAHNVTVLPGEDPLEVSGAIGGNNGTRPKWRSTTQLLWNTDTLNVGVKWRYYEKMISGAAIGVPNSTAVGVPDIHYFDLFGGWAISDKLTLRGGIINLFDKTPPNYTNSVQANTEPGTYDVLMRRFFVGLTARF
jgi:outer membrane receptor protein involved in Fe transport